MKKRILITGAYGFLGNALWEFLEEKNLEFDIWGIAKNGKKSPKKIILCDINRSQKLLSVLSWLKPALIFHFAGGRKPNDREIFASNFLTTKSLFETVLKIKNYHPRIIIPGTAAEYGCVRSTEGLIDECVPAHPASWYGFVKFMQTSLGLMFAQKGLLVTVARMFNILGPGVPPTLAIGKFAKDIVLMEKNAKPRTLHTKNLDGRRDFLDIRDVCEALVAVAKYGQSGEIYNICSGKSFRIRELLEQLLSFSTIQGITIKEDKHSSSQSHDIIGSNRKIKKITSWHPKISMKKSIEETLHYYRKQILKTKV